MKKAIFFRKRDNIFLQGLIDDINFLLSVVGNKKSNIIKDIEEDLKNAVAYLNDNDINTIKGVLNYFYKNYQIENKKEIEKSISDLEKNLVQKARVRVVHMDSNLTNIHQLVYLENNLLKILEREIKSRQGVERIDIGIFFEEKKEGQLSLDEKKLLEDIKYVCENEVKQTPGVKNIKKLGVSKIEEIYRTINRNKKANDRLSIVVSELKDKLGMVQLQEENKKYLRGIIEALEGIIERNKRENENLQNTLGKLDLNLIEKVIFEHKHYDSKEKGVSSKFKSNKGENIIEKAADKLGDLNQDIKNKIEDKIEKKEEEKKQQKEEHKELMNEINELIDKAFNTLFENAKSEVEFNLMTSSSTVDEHKQEIHDIMVRNLSMLNLTLEERAQQYLKLNGIKETSSSLNDAMSTLYDRNIGVDDFKKLVSFVNENITDKREAKDIIDKAFNRVYNYNRSLDDIKIL